MNLFDQPDNQDLKTQNSSMESGDATRYTRVIDDSGSPVLAGKYMEMTLKCLRVNVPLIDRYDGITRKFTLLEVVFNNLWNHRISTKCAKSPLLIDSEGFQHEEGDYKGNYLCFDQEVNLDTGELTEVELPKPALDLEGNAKTRGWMWFHALPEGVIPHRLIFPFHIFEPGQTSGWVQDMETLEFVITSYAQISPKELQ